MKEWKEVTRRLILFEASEEKYWDGMSFSFSVSVDRLEMKRLYGKILGAP